MTSTAVQPSLVEAVDALGAAVDAALAAPLGVVADEQLLDLVRELEMHRRRLAAVDARVVGEMGARGLAHEHGARNTVSLLGLLLRIDPGEARARVRAAEDLAARTTLSGERLGPALPIVAAAVAEGAISAAHARVISRGIDALPLDVQATRDREIEAHLVAEARRFAPRQLAKLTERLVYLYDQDGRLATDADRARRRALDYRRHADGTLSGTFRLDPVTAEAFETVIDAHLTNTTAADRGERTPTQLRHDALRDVLLAIVRAGQLPASGGVTTTMVVTLTAAQYLAVHALAQGSAEPGDQRGRNGPAGADQFGDAAATDRGGTGRHAGPPGEGLAVTAHGALLGLAELAPLLGDAQTLAVVLSDLGPLRRIESYGDKHRLFTENQRLAMVARDHGCTFPGCTTSPAYCEAHHVTAFEDGGRTSVANGALVCPYHHRTYPRLGYECRMIDGVPHWIAPAWIDPTRTPQRNTAHQPAHGPLP